jgi:hypothetical protein
LYYDRPLQDYQLTILSNPNNFNLYDFYCGSLINAIKRFCVEQAEEINGMKREGAKQKRAEKTMQIIKKTKNEVQIKCSASSSYSVALSNWNN